MTDRRVRTARRMPRSRYAGNPAALDGNTFHTALDCTAVPECPTVGMGETLIPGRGLNPCPTVLRILDKECPLEFPSSRVDRNSIPRYATAFAPETVRSFRLKIHQHATAVVPAVRPFVALPYAFIALQPHRADAKEATKAGREAR